MTARVTPDALLVAAVTLLGGFLRFHDLGAAPFFLDNADELQFVWAGIGMILHGDAYTWSYFPAYPSPGVLQAYGATFPMVHHWLDHPPLFGYLMGAWVLLLGNSSITAQDVVHVRILPALFATATIPLTWAIGREALGRGAAIAGAVLLATAPAAVLIGREAEPESIQAPLMLVAILLAWRQARAERLSPWVLGLLALICTAEPLFKVSGAAVGGVAAVIFLMRGRVLPAAVCAGSAVLGLAIYVAYGWLVDWQLFQAVIRGQASNRLSLMTAYEYVVEPAGINRRLRDPWWLLGWIGIGGIAMLGRRSRGEALVALPVAAYLATMLLLAGTVTTGQYGWYKLMVLPLVYLAAGAVCWRLAAAPSPSRALLVMCLGGAMATTYWVGGPYAEWVPNPFLAAALLAAVMLPAAAVAARRFERYESIARYAAAGALVFIAFGNVVTSLSLAGLFGRM